ncbi:MAG: AI-2E family transporter [Bacteroidota bacterium]
MKLEKAAYLSIILAFVGVLLLLAKDLLIPIVLAVFVWFIIREIRMVLRKNKFIRQHIPRWLENLIASIFLFTIIVGLLSVVTTNVELLSLKIPHYEKNVTDVIKIINDLFKIDLFDELKTFTGNLNFSTILRMTLNSITAIFSNVFIILIYVLFMLLEESGFVHKLRAIYPERENLDATMQILDKIDHSVGKYLILKTLVSTTTGLLSYAVLLMIGIDAAFFWAFIIFVLNYIPTIGSLIGTLFPAFFALLQFGELGPALWVLGIIGVIQVLIGNFLEPKIMGNSLNLSPLVVILALSIWGALWGITGMILSVPITVVLLILFSEFPGTRSIAIFLSEKGKLKQ